MAVSMVINILTTFPLASLLILNVFLGFFSHFPQSCRRKDKSTQEQTQANQESNDGLLSGGTIKHTVLSFSGTHSQLTPMHMVHSHSL